MPGRIVDLYRRVINDAATPEDLYIYPQRGRTHRTLAGYVAARGDQTGVGGTFPAAAPDS
jgi:hypothetical protein